MLFHSKSFGAAIEQLWVRMAQQAITMEAQSLAHHVAAEVAKAAATQASQNAQTLAQTQGVAARSQVGILEDLKSIERAAATAAAHAFKWVMEEVPFPANAVLAPAAATAAFAGVLAFESIGSFAEGGIVPTDMIARVHENEMVLPEELAETVKRGVGMLGTSSSTTQGDDDSRTVHEGTSNDGGGIGMGNPIVERLIEQGKATGNFGDVLMAAIY